MTIGTTTTVRAAARVRSSANSSSSSNVLYEIKAGVSVTLQQETTAEGYYWYKCKNNADSSKPVGWIRSDLLNPSSSGGGTGGGDSGLGTANGTAKSGVVVGTSVNLRKGPGTSYGTDGSLSSGSQIKYHQSQLAGGLYWLRISSPKNAWICADYVKAGVNAGLMPTICTVCGKSMSRDEKAVANTALPELTIHAHGNTNEYCSGYLATISEETYCTGNSSHPTFDRTSRSGYLWKCGRITFQK